MGMDFDLKCELVKKTRATVTILDTEKTLSKWKGIAEKYVHDKSYCSVPGGPSPNQ